MKVLKMIADWHSEKPEGTRNYDDIPMEERDHNSWWYLHGNLEELVRYDKATVTNCLSGGFSRPTVPYGFIRGNKVNEIVDYKPWHMMYLNGKVDVEIEGVDKPCVGWFWTEDERTIYWQDKPYQAWHQRGLVCLVDDVDGCQYAEQVYNERRKFI